MKGGDFLGATGNGKRLGGLAGKKGGVRVEMFAAQRIGRTKNIEEILLGADVV